MISRPGLSEVGSRTLWCSLGHRTFVEFRFVTSNLHSAFVRCFVASASELVSRRWLVVSRRGTDGRRDILPAGKLPLLIHQE
jgi:hypothetical protein